MLKRGNGRHIWMGNNHFASNDITAFEQSFEAQSVRLNFSPIDLGKVEGHTVRLYHAPHKERKIPRVLIAAGFHGDEPAGCWGILDFLTKQNPSLNEQIALSFLPLVNVGGFQRGCRLNNQHENPNRGYLYQEGIKPSFEADMLLNFSRLLQDVSADGVLCCHEDILSQNAYVYSYENAPEAGPMSYSITTALGRFFSIEKEAIIDGCQCHDGLIFNHSDSSFESWLFQQGARVAMCTETPGLAGFEQRIQANSHVIGTFISEFLHE